MNLQQQSSQQKSQDSGINGVDGTDGTDIYTDVSILSEIKWDLLKKFCNKVDKFKHSLCTICNEKFSFIVIVKGECQHYYKENALKKFLTDNNMDPDEMPNKLQNLIEKLKKCWLQEYFP